MASHTQTIRKNWHAEFFSRLDEYHAVEGVKTMPDLTPEEILLAQEIAYKKSLSRSNGQAPPTFNPEAAVGDFWQAAREVIARHGRASAPNHWQVMYGTRNIIRGLVVQEGASQTGNQEDQSLHREKHPERRRNRTEAGSQFRQLGTICRTARKDALGGRFLFSANRDETGHEADVCPGLALHDDTGSDCIRIDRTSQFRLGGRASRFISRSDGEP